MRVTGATNTRAILDALAEMLSRIVNKIETPTIEPVSKDEYEERLKWLKQYRANRRA